MDVKINSSTEPTSLTPALLNLLASNSHSSSSTSLIPALPTLTLLTYHNGLANTDTSDVRPSLRYAQQLEVKGEHQKALDTYERGLQVRSYPNSYPYSSFSPANRNKSDDSHA
jgi:hypothetical protein